MKNKATHKGTCQVCGATQKLPAGRLSTHGYTVQWGFFSGICTGTGHLPFEQDISLIEGAIDRAQALRDETAAESAALKAGKQLEGNKCWSSEYFPKLANRSDRGYRWVQVATRAEEHEYSSGGTYLTFFKQADNEKEERVSGHYGCKTLDAFRTEKNKYYAEVCLDKYVQELDRYIGWQKNRIANWKPSALIEI